MLEVIKHLTKCHKHHCNFLQICFLSHNLSFIFITFYRAKFISKIFLAHLLYRMLLTLLVHVSYSCTQAHGSVQATSPKSTMWVRNAETTRKQSFLASGFHPSLRTLLESSHQHAESSSVEVCRPLEASIHLLQEKGSTYDFADSSPLFFSRKLSLSQKWK